MTKSSSIHLHNRSRYYCQKRIAEFDEVEAGSVFSRRSTFDQRSEQAPSSYGGACSDWGIPVTADTVVSRQCNGDVISKNWTLKVYSYFFGRLLAEIEYFSPTDFEDNSDSEMLAYFGLMSDTARDELSEEVMFEFEDLIQQGVSVKEIDATILAAHQDFLNFLENYSLPEYDAPMLPYRRILSYTEYEKIWARFGPLWLKLGDKPSKMIDFPDFYLTYELPVKSIANELQEMGVNRLLNLGSAANYEVDITLMDDMFSYDDTYWTSKTLDWYIWAGGHGYPEIAGPVIEKVMTTIPWLTNPN